VEHANTNSENSHFNEELWADFVRGLGDQAAREEMQSHLDSGCAECQASFKWLDSIVRFALAERHSEVSDELAAQARQIRALPSRPRWMETWETVTAQLIQQASWAWQPAGVRSPGGPEAAGRMLFRAGDYLVDLQVETQSSGAGREIVGQIANEQEQGEILDGIIVEMFIPGRTLRETATNRFGEFVIECPSVKNATLRFGLTHRKQRIELPLRVQG
jgi:hypothetical protein